MQKAIVFLIFILFFTSCKEEKIENNEASLLKMSFDFGEVLFKQGAGTINAPVNTDLKKLTPEITVSRGAVVYPASKAITDFSLPVDYTVTSEDGKNKTYYTVSVFAPIVRFVVYDCSNRTAQNPVAQLTSGVKISLYVTQSGKKHLVEKITTDSNGEALFYGLRNADYYFLAEKGAAKNILNGYQINGIFESQQDIDNYPHQNPAPKVGDLKFLDADVDGKINENDKVDYPMIGSIPETGTAEVKIYIAKQ